MLQLEADKSKLMEENISLLERIEFLTKEGNNVYAELGKIKKRLSDGGVDVDNNGDLPHLTDEIEKIFDPSNSAVQDSQLDIPDFTKINSAFSCAQVRLRLL